MVEEKLSVIEHLSRLISTQLGLREQLEVIRLINPTANVSPTDTEFVISKCFTYLCMDLKI